MSYKIDGVPIFDGLYIITKDGKLYSCRSGKYLSPDTDRYGYIYYVISILGKRYTLKAHRLVAQAYLPNPENKPTVNHINGNRMDNNVSNLEWATYKEQQADPLTTVNRHKVVAKTDYYWMASLKNFGRKTTSVYKNGILIGQYNSLSEAAKCNNVSPGHASQCANGQKRSIKGLVFCYG